MMVAKSFTDYFITSNGCSNKYNIRNICDKVYYSIGKQSYS